MTMCHFLWFNQLVDAGEVRPLPGRTKIVHRLLQTSMSVNDEGGLLIFTEELTDALLLGQDLPKVCVLRPSSCNPAERGPAWAYLSDDLEPENNARAERYSRGTNEEINAEFRESVSDYPTETIAELISAAPPLSLFFVEKKVPKFGRRHNAFDRTEDKSMCEMTFRTHWPQKLKNVNGLEKFIVNQKKSYQPVFVGSCSENASCLLKGSFPTDYESRCKQNYSIVRLVALNSTIDKNLVVDEFNVGCGCVCTIRRL